MVIDRFWRILKHLFTLPSTSERFFPKSLLDQIAATIEESEKQQTGQICFVVESCLKIEQIWSGLTPRERAKQVFLKQGLWDTEGNNGVLLYLLIADRDIEIIADRGIASKVDPSEWESICQKLEADLRAGKVAGVVSAIKEIGSLLEKFFRKN